jgi:hypothetical protein
MGAEKQKVTQEERNLAEFSKKVMDKGASMSDAHSAAATRDMLAKTNASVASQTSAQRAIGMKMNIAKNRLSDQRNVAATTPNSVVENTTESFGLTANASKNDLDRMGRGAQGGVRAAAQLGKLGGKLASNAYDEEHARFVNGNQRRQGLMDLGSLAIVEGLGAKWDKDTANAKKAATDNGIASAAASAKHQTAFDQFGGSGYTPYESPEITDPYKRNYFGSST